MSEELCEFIWSDNDDTEYSHECDRPEGHIEAHRCMCGDQY